MRHMRIVRSTTTLRAWELVALSLDIDPSSLGLAGTERFSPDKIQGAAMRDEFNGRMDDVKHALNVNALVHVQAYVFGPQSWVLRAGEFASWARNQGWTLPDVFEGLNHPISSEQSAPAGEAATIAEQGTPAEQWKAAAGDRKRRAQLALEMVNECQGNKSKAARCFELGKSTGPLYRALKYARENHPANIAPSVAGDARMYSQLAGKPDNT